MTCGAALTIRRHVKQFNPKFILWLKLSASASSATASWARPIPTPGARPRGFSPFRPPSRCIPFAARNAAAVEDARAKFGWERAATDWREVVASPDIDIVDIATSNLTHAEIGLAAAKAGKHIFCEKPLAMNLAEAKKMLAAVRPRRRQEYGRLQLPPRPRHRLRPAID